MRFATLCTSITTLRSIDNDNFAYANFSYIEVNTA